MKKILISLGVFVGLALPALMLVPAQAGAQTSTTGLLNVYVQVLKQYGYSAFPNYAAGDFTVAVLGNSPSLTSFAGSINGTLVQLYPGSYNVTVATLGGYTPTYSVGCSNTIAAGQSQTCVVTMTPTYGYQYQNQNFNYYQYGYQYWGVPALTCRPLTPSVTVGQAVTFEATGGAGGTYNWTAPYTQSLNYPNAGRQITVVFQAAGQQSVTVTNAAQTASCSVLVTQGYYPYSTYPYGYNYNYNYNQYTSPTYVQPAYTAPYTAPAPVITYTTTYPQMPRTGFGPQDPSFGIVLSVVLLIAAGIITAPYARKALAVIGR